QSGNQGQHRISAVYMRHFGFLKGDQWKITALDKSKKEHMFKIGRRWTSEKSIDSVTVVTNLFDLNGADPSLRRMLEENFGLIETDYPKFIGELHSGFLSEETKAKIIHFMGSLLIRQHGFREVVNRIIRSEHG